MVIAELGDIHIPGNSHEQIAVKRAVVFQDGGLVHIVDNGIQVTHPVIVEIDPVERGPYVVAVAELIKHTVHVVIQVKKVIA